jgi:hypothetical protein
MARCPFAQQRILPENATQARITPRAVILHTAVDGPGDTDLAAYFGQASVKAESHFYVTRRGVVVQMMDTTVEADANGTADKWAISVETEDDSAGRGSDILPWNQAQLDAIVKLTDWCCHAHAIPRRRATSAKLPGASGIAYHSQPMRERFDGTRHNPWTAYQGKTCPGDARVAQYPGVVARVAAITTPPPIEDDAMTPAQEAALHKRLDDLYKKLDALAVGPGWGHPQGTLPLLARIAKKLGA